MKKIITIIIIILIAVGIYSLFTKKNPDNTTNTDYIGLTTAEANNKAESNGVIFRVVEIDGKPQMTTKDFREGRVNAVITNGLVTSYTIETNESKTINHDVIIGMTENEAEAYAIQNNILFRVGTIDGEGMPVTLDFRPGRITAELKNGVVIGYTTE